MLSVRLLSMRSVSVALAMLLSLSCIERVQAGALIAAGTDADDHGSVSGGVNQQGWFFMQRALENIAPSVTNGNKKVVTLGSNSSGGLGALDAATSAFNLSTLPGLGWTFGSVDGVTGINNFFGGVGAHTVGNTGIFMVDSSFQVSGGIDALEDAALTANATGINNFLGAGGGAFTQFHSYGWLSTLVPGLTTASVGDTGIALTAAGSAAFPGLTNADLSAGPFHNSFGGSLGGLSVFGTSTSGVSIGRPIIIGISGGSVTNPNTTPEPSGFIVWSLLAMGTLARRTSRLRN